MGWFLIIIGAIWLVYHLAEEASWKTNAYDGKMTITDVAKVVGVSRATIYNYITIVEGNR